MNVLLKHPLVRTDISAAINWYEDAQPGLGADFWENLRAHYRILPRDAGL
jgi:hypothetical protein